LGAYRLAVAYTLRFVIPDSSSSILLVEDDAGWALPRVPSDEPEIVIHVAPTLRDLVGRDIFVLRDLRFGSMPPPDDAIVYVTEPHPDPSAARGRWCTEADLQPWQRAGWFETCVAWIEDVLPDVFHVRQFATWCNSCILRVGAAAGRSYVKASPAYFAREPIVTAMLAELFPGRTPEVLAVDADRRWMVLEDLGDEPADGLAVGERLGALAAIAELHAASMSHVDALLDGGCFDRRPDVLSAQIAALAADPTVPLPGDLAERFRAAVPRLQELCAELALSPIQPTLVHGDLHAGNVMRTGGRFVVFDWTDACVADPFVDVLMFLTRLPDDPRLRARFGDRYFEAWGDVVSRSEAAEYAELAEPLAAMHHAVTYRGIYDAFGEYEWWLFERALPRWIEHALGSRLLSPRGSPNGI
jgi:hypothetical protein